MRPKVVYRLAMKGWTMEEIAKELGITAVQAKNSLEVYKRRLRNEERIKQIEDDQNRKYEQEDLMYLSSQIEQIRGLIK